jgi:hypothetical protein
MAPAAVWTVEVVAGLVVAALFAYALTRLRRVRAPGPAQEPLSSD